MTSTEFRIIDENGAEFISAETIRTFANMAGTSARRQADKDCAEMNATGDGKYRVERINGLREYL